MKSSKSDSSAKSELEIPWWKKGIFSEISPVGKWLHRFLALFSKREDVSESTVFLYNRAMSEIRILGKSAELIDNEKFGKEEFLIFVKIKYQLSKNIGEYAGLDESVKLLQLAIDAKDSFISIDQTEFRYRGGKQQDFYLFTDQLLLNYGDTTNFRQTIQVKLADVIPTVKTEEGRTALQSYSQHLDRLSEHQLGLRLLSLFKAYNLADYSILRRISDLIQGLDKYDLCTYTPIINVVQANYDDFDKLQKIINLPASKSTPETYALMSQVIALYYRYALSFVKFEELMMVLKRWYRPYQTIINLREAHPPNKFKQPSVFQDPIPGESVYLKYLKWLTDQKTGLVYIDFESEDE